MIQKVNKILILGIDALEYDLVEEWDLKNLKQEEYGKTELPLRKDIFDGEPMTYVMWPSFITGLPPEKHNVKNPTTWNNVMAEKLKDLYIKLGADKNKKLTKNIKKILARFGFSSRYIDKRDLKVSTIFDKEKRYALNVPGYSPMDEINLRIRRGMVKAIENKYYRIHQELLLKKVYEQRKLQLLEYITKNWEILMQYFQILDAVQHMFYSQISKIYEYYVDMDKFVGKIKQEIDNNTLFLIVSDHGQKKGIHTKHGFYSLNKPLGLKNPKLIDFRWIIEEILEDKNEE